MNDERERDPEIEQDRWLREDSTRDRSRNRVSEAAIGRWKPEPIVGMWRCRGLNPSNPCPQRANVGVTADTIAQWMAFNAQLRKRGEDPIDSDEIVRCDACRRGIAHQRAPKLRERVEQVAQCIRDLKASPAPRKERELLKQLEAWNHPDLPGLLQAIEERSKGGGRKVRRDEL